MKGLHTYRFKENPEERRFSLAWARINQSPKCAAPVETLRYLMGNGQSRADISKRDEVVAATVIQWLGSPVGQSFLEELGYSKARPE